MVQTVSGLNYVYKVPRIEHSHTAPRLFETQKFKFSTIYFQQDALNHFTRVAKTNRVVFLTGPSKIAK